MVKFSEIKMRQLGFICYWTDSTGKRRSTRFPRYENTGGGYYGLAQCFVDQIAEYLLTH